MGLRLKIMMKLAALLLFSANVAVAEVNQYETYAHPGYNTETLGDDYDVFTKGSADHPSDGYRVIRPNINHNDAPFVDSTKSPEIATSKTQPHHGKPDVNVEGWLACAYDTTKGRHCVETPADKLNHTFWNDIYDEGKSKNFSEWSDGIPMHARIRGDKSCYISCSGKSPKRGDNPGAGSEDDMDKQYTNNYASAPVGEKWYVSGNKGSMDVRTGKYIGGKMDGLLDEHLASGTVYSAGASSGGFAENRRYVDPMTGDHGWEALGRENGDPQRITTDPNSVHHAV